MRSRLLDGGPDSLADFELLEMLLFLAIPRRDTKPLTRTIFDRCGDLYSALTTLPASLCYIGLEPVVIELFALACETARRLADVQAVLRPQLNDTGCLLDYLELPARLQRPPHLAALLLDNRNQVLAEVSCPETQETPEVAMTVARRALESHATAIILVTCRPGVPPTASARDIDLMRRVGRATSVLAVLHCHIICGAGRTVSIRREDLGWGGKYAALVGGLCDADDAGWPRGGFDPAIGVSLHTLPPRIAQSRAVQAMPKAGWSDVKRHVAGSGNGAAEVLPPGAGAPSDEMLPLRAEGTALTAISAMSVVSGYPEVAAKTQLDAAELRALGDSELLAHLLGLVIPGSVSEMARQAVAQLGSFAAVLAAPEITLRKLPGLGTHGVAAVKLLHAAALRLLRGAIMDQPVLDGSAPLIDYLTAVLARESIEHFRILFLDAQNRLRADEAQARGTVDHTPVYPREVVRRALELRAASIILVHNHPSGDPSPSPADLTMTAMVVKAAAAVQVTVRDHIIVGAGRWFSFRDAGMLIGVGF